MTESSYPVAHLIGYLQKPQEKDECTDLDLWENDWMGLYVGLSSNL